MSKNLRSFITILSLAFMLLAGMFTPYAAQARGDDAEQKQSSIVWKASAESAAQFQKLAEEMGGQIEMANVRQAKRLQASSDVQISEDQVSPNELANWAKVQKQMADNDENEPLRIIIIIVTDDYIIIIVID